MFGARYLADNWSASQEHRKYNEKDVKYRDNVAKKASGKLNCPLAPTSKEVKHIHILLFYD